VANSVHRDRQGPDWPLGFIAVAASGTPVNLMVNVDSAKVNAPETPTPGTAGADEYTARAQQMIFQGMHPSAGKMINNTGMSYILRAPAGGGTGNLTDTGTIVALVPPGVTIVISSAPLNRNVYNPYRYFVDTDVSGEGVQATLLMQ
jgi:hypothetical protein